MKHTLGSMATSINKIASFETMIINNPFLILSTLSKKTKVDMFSKVMMVRISTVHSKYYGDMLTDFFAPRLEVIYISDMWFQQDGATCLKAHNSINLLKETFDKRLILQNRFVYVVM